jgi:hypothetical protein
VEVEEVLVGKGLLLLLVAEGEDQELPSDTMLFRHHFFLLQPSL